MTETTTAVVTEETKPEVKPPAINSKQQVAINNIVSGISTERPEVGDPKFEAILEDGNVFLMAEGWPTLKIGKEGGISIPDLRSYADPLHAAIHADELVKKQAANDLKKEEKKQADAAKAVAKAAPAPVVAEKEAFATGEAAQ